KSEPVRKTISSFKRRLTSSVKPFCERESSSGLRIHLSGSRPRTEILVLSATDALVNSVIEDAVIGLSTLFTSHPPRLVSRLERRLLHRSIAHRESVCTCKMAPLKLPLRQRFRSSRNQLFGA